MSVIKKLFVIFFTVIASGSVLAGDIAYGKVIGIKVFGSPDLRITKVFFAADSEKLEPLCSDRSATITHSFHTKHPEEMQQMLSVALAGYMSGKRVRAYSFSSASCEVHMMSIQDSYF